MKHLDLFSGIGGFALAVDTVWPNSEHIFCDNDKFCQLVLKKHWPQSKIYGDIKTLTREQVIADTQSGKPREQAQQKRWQDTGGSYCDILTGGFPCQPFSQAGKRRGTADNRYLWPEMLRVIQDFKPTFVIAENVRGLLTMSDGLVFQQVCLDLESAGYEVQPFIIPAVAVNTPHRRDRIWFVAHNTSKGLEGSRGKEWRFASQDSNDSDTASEQCDNGNDYRKERQIQNDKRITEKNKSERNGRECGVGEIDDAKNSISERSGRGMENNRQILECQSPEIKNERPNWDKNWLEVATELCGVDDGLSEGMDFAGFTKAGHRVQRLKSLGNSIVPQVAIQIMHSLI